MELTLRPDDTSLAAGLRALLNDGGFAQGDVTVLEREPNIYSSSYASDIVRCRLPHGDELRLLCKYGSDETLRLGHGAHGARGGVGYEASVYRDVLTLSTLPTPAFFGSRIDPKGGQVWLVVEHLGGHVFISVRPYEAMPAAARWLGAFHREHAGRRADLRFLNRWDREYYLGFVERAAVFVDSDEDGRLLLARLADRFDDWAAPLLRDLTVVHGEYYPTNVLFANETVYPIDWESAAIGAGEVDLAALTEALEPELAGALEETYLRARWPEGAPAEFYERLTAARIFLACRWLGDRPDWDQPAHRFSDLRRLADDARLMPPRARRANSSA